MPTTSVSASAHRAEDILVRLSSDDADVKLKALRDVKNQIIGNRTKKLSFLKIGAVPAVVSALSSAGDASISGIDSSLLVQSAAALGSFACGFDAGVRAVLDAGAFPLLFQLISYSDEKVVDAGARSLKMIYQSKYAPKYDFLQEENMEFLLSLLNSNNENVTGLGASILSHSCETSIEQKALCDAGVLKRLISLLDGSLSQRDSSLESLSTIIKNNPEVISKFVGPESGRALSTVIELTKDRYPRTSLLACLCLIAIRNTSPTYLQDIRIITKLIVRLLELLDDSGQVGDEASFALSSLIVEKEDLQKLAFEVNAVNKLCNQLIKGPLPVKRLQGLLLGLADLCSKLERCRSRLISLEVLNLIADALGHENVEVQTAACVCLRSVSRSVKNLSAGYFMNDMIVIPLVRLLCDPSTSVQVAALGTVSNIVVDFTTHKSMFIHYGGAKQLVELSKSMISTVRLNAIWALRNLMFLADNSCKESVLLELTPSLIATLVCDPEPPVQEQALALVRNLVDGCINSIDYVFAEDRIILNAVGRQLHNALKVEVEIQGMYVLSNVASGTNFHKEAVMEQLLPDAGDNTESVLIKFLQNSESRLRTGAIWALVNLTFPSSLGACDRVLKLRNAGVISQVKNMVNDPCMDVKLRVRTVLGQSMTFGDGSI